MNNRIILEPSRALAHLFFNLRYQFYKQCKLGLCLHPIPSLNQIKKVISIFFYNNKIANDDTCFMSKGGIHL